MKLKTKYVVCRNALIVVSLILIGVLTVLIFENTDTIYYKLKKMDTNNIHMIETEDKVTLQSGDVTINIIKSR